MHIHMNGPYTPEQFERMMKFLENEQEQAMRSDNARHAQHQSTIAFIQEVMNRYGSTLGIGGTDGH